MSYKALVAAFSRAAKQGQVVRLLRGRYIHPDFYIEGMELIVNTPEKRIAALLESIGREMHLQEMHAVLGGSSSEEVSYSALKAATGRAVKKGKIKRSRRGFYIHSGLESEKKTVQ